MRDTKLIKKGSDVPVQELFVGLLIIGIGVFIGTFYSYHFSFQEQTHIFLYNSLFLNDYWSKPAFLSRYLGDFFIQFFYLKGGAAVVISFLMLMLYLGNYLLLKRIYRDKKVAALFGIFPFLAAFVLLLNFEYNIASFISFLIISWLLVGYSFLPFARYRFLVSLAFLPVGYFLLGGDVIYWGFLTLIVDIMLSRNKDFRSVLLASIPFVMGLFVPLFFRVLDGLSYEQAYLWPLTGAGSIGLFWKSFPYLILTLSLAGTFLNNKFSAFSQWTVVLIVSGFILAVGIYHHADFKIERILALDSEWYYGNIDAVQDLSKTYSYQSSAAAYYQNLANASEGKMAENFFDVQQTGSNGLFLPVGNQESYLSIIFSNEVGYFLGDVNGSQHSALLGMIFSPNQYSTRLLRRLVQINIINKEYKVAEKYLKILSQTLFHRKWAKQLLSVLSEEARVSRIPWVMQKRALTPESTEIRKPNDHLKVLELLLQENPENVKALEYKLCYHLLRKELDLFARTFFDHKKVLLARKTPKLYQEALVLFHLKEPDLEIWENIPVSNKIIARFVKYTKKYEESEGYGEPLQEEFDKTYWFYYHYALIGGE